MFHTAFWECHIIQCKKDVQANSCYPAVKVLRGMNQLICCIYLYVSSRWWWWLELKNVIHWTPTISRPTETNQLQISDRCWLGNYKTQSFLFVWMTQDRELAQVLLQTQGVWWQMKRAAAFCTRWPTLTRNHHWSYHHHPQNNGFSISRPHCISFFLRVGYQSVSRIPGCLGFLEISRTPHLLIRQLPLTWRILMQFFTGKKKLKQSSTKQYCQIIETKCFSSHSQMVSDPQVLLNHNKQKECPFCVHPIEMWSKC